MRDSRKAYLFTFITILCWGGAATAFKTALKTLPPSVLLGTSVLVSVSVMTLLLVLSGRWSELGQLSRRQWAYLAVLGGINPFLYYLILFQAYDLLPGQVAMSLNYLWPVMLAILSVPLLKHSLSLMSLVSICMSFVGALLIASRGDFSDWGQLDPWGLGYVLASTLVWAVYWLLSARMPVDASVKLWVGFVSGSVLIWLYLLFAGELQINMGEFPWLAVGYVGVFEMGLTFFIWLKALQLAPNVARIGNFIYLTPFVSLLILALVLGESIYPTTVVGLLVIVSGILLQQYHDRVRT